jgi:exopolysaccharide production protein ExoZ
LRSIVEIQYLRAVAVLLVVLGHTHQHEARFFSDPLLGDAAYFGFGGVDLFFVISGYIIHRIFGSRSSIDGRFFLNRLNRIYPLYWVFTGAALVGYLTIGDSLTRGVGELDLARSLTLAPSSQPPILMVGWTLTHELYFYLAYGLLSILPRRARPWVASAWGLMTLAFMLWPLSGMPPWLALLTSPFNLLFLAGGLIAQFSDSLSKQRWPALALLLAGLAMGLIWANNAGLAGLANIPVRVAVLTPFAIGAVWAGLAWAPNLPALLARIGDWSYSIYLGHILMIGVVARLLARSLGDSFWTSPVFYGTAFVASLTLGWLTHIALEKPLLNLGKMGIDRLFSRARDTRE